MLQGVIKQQLARVKATLADVAKMEKQGKNVRALKLRTVKKERELETFLQRF